MTGEARTQYFGLATSGQRLGFEMRVVSLFEVERGWHTWRGLLGGAIIPRMTKTYADYIVSDAAEKLADARCAKTAHLAAQLRAEAQHAMLEAVLRELVALRQTLQVPDNA